MSPVPAIGLSFGLILLWVGGVSHQESAWLTWFDFVAGLIAFSSAARFAESRRAGVVGWSSLGLGLLVLSIAAVATGGRSWLASWTFVSGCAFLILAGIRSRRRELQINGSA